MSVRRQQPNPQLFNNANDTPLGKVNNNVMGFNPAARGAFFTQESLGLDCGLERDVKVKRQGNAQRKLDKAIRSSYCFGDSIDFLRGGAKAVATASGMGKKSSGVAKTACPAHEAAGASRAQAKNHTHNHKGGAHDKMTKKFSYMDLGVQESGKASATASKMDKKSSGAARKGPICQSCAAKGLH